MTTHSAVSRHELIVLLPDQRGLDTYFEKLPVLRADAAVINAVDAALAAVDAAPADVVDAAPAAVVDAAPAAGDAAPADVDAALAAAAAVDVPAYPGTSCARSPFSRWKQYERSLWSDCRGLCSSF